MAWSLNYGRDRTIKFDLPPDRESLLCSPSHDHTVADPAAAVVAALQEPLDYPPVSLATVPGDLVAIALEEGLPQAPALVAGVVKTLLGGGVEPSHILIVETESAAAPGAVDPRAELPPDLAAEVQRVIHNPSDVDELCFLGMNESGEPVYLNRAICEADLVIPIGCMQPRSVYGYRGIYTGIYPAFSDRAAQERLLQPRRINRAAEVQAQELYGSDTSPAPAKKKRKASGKSGTGKSSAAKAARAKEKDEKLPSQQADEVGWLLGSRLVVQVVPGTGDDIAAVLCGDVDSVMKRGQELCDELWAPHVPGRYRLVVSAIAGDAGQQTWNSVAKALAAARRIVADDGAIALCTELETPPGPSLMRITESRDLDAALAQVDEDRAYDSPAAAQLIRALQTGPVYLLSRLDPDVVESLGMAPVQSADQVAKLASRFDSCLLVAGGQYAAPQVEP